jgi:hypothetical protein
MFGAKDDQGLKPDIDVKKIFKKLKKDHYAEVLCEGCGMVAIGNMDGKLKVRYINSCEWHDYGRQLRKSK